MKIDSKNYYRLLGPRLTVCVSTQSPKGTPNLAPYSFATPLSFDPPLLGFSSGGGKDTLLNARETKEFVVAPLTSDWATEGIKAEVSLSREESEFQHVGLTQVESEVVNPPSIGEAPINIECEYWDHYETGDHIFLVGKVVNISAEEGALRNSRVNVEELRPVGHISGEEFCISEGVTKIRREG